MAQVQRVEKEAANWFPVIAFGFLATCSQMMWMTFAPIATSAASFFGVTVLAVSVLAVVFPFTHMFAGIPAGLSLDRWFRGALAAGATVTAIGGVLRFAANGSFAIVLVGQILIALVQPLVLNSMTQIVVRHLPPSKRQAGLAMNSAALLIGFLLAFITGGILSDSIEQLLGLQAGLTVLAALLTLLGILKVGPYAAEATASAGERGFVGPLREVFRQPVLRTLALLVALGFGVFSTIMTLSETLLTPQGVPVRAAAAMSVLMIISGLIGTVIFPLIANKRHMHASWFIGAYALTGLGLLILAIHVSVPIGLLAFTVIGLALIPTLPMELHLSALFAKDFQSTANSVIWLSGNFGSVILSVVCGLLAQEARVAFLVLAVAAACGCLTSVEVRRRVRQLS